MKTATWNGTVLAEAEDSDCIMIEGNIYMPLSSVKEGVLVESDTQYHCPWKGDAKYFDVVVDGQTNKDACFQYPDAMDSAVKRVGKDFKQHVAFWQGVEVA